ncbi:copper transporter [Dactylosporangium sp. AC04546]|uniref:copper transporter n=1 Tax=Dactylosporangium sp. AC04546 TaxID=2862460 RepID=UPI001EDF2AEB|nr:copper transporter [Dactylosporangium sp. AC04546]WVK88361.1 copper transporter [Dactylosporangium sp. AC04546]
MSLAAAFLALAIGLVVGTAAANGPIVENLNDQVVKISNEKQQLRNELDQAQTELGKNEGFANESASRLLAGTLTGRNTLVIELQGDGGRVDRAADEVVNRLRLAGAKVTGHIKIKDDFFSAAANDELLDLANASAPPGVAGALPGGVDGVERAGALLAALLSGKADAPQVEGIQAVLHAYKDFLTAKGEFDKPADGVVIVAGPPPSGKDASERIARARTLVTRFHLAGGKVVVAGLSAAGLVAAVRTDAALAKSLSTVDNASAASGQIAAALALSELLDGKVNHCGTGEGATGFLPKWAPSNGGSVRAAEPFTAGPGGTWVVEALP